MLRRTVVLTTVLVLMISSFSVLWAQPAEKAATAVANDDDRVVVSVDGVELKAWQAKVLMAHEVGRTEMDVANFWVDMTIRAAEAKRRGLNQSRENQFILGLFQDHYLGSRILEMQLRKELPELTEEQLKAQYDENIERYQKPANVSVQHIVVMERPLAKQLIEQAKGGADFTELVQKHTVVDDKKYKGYVRGADKILINRLGEKITAEILQAQKGDVLGPFVGNRGFEVIKVDDIKLAHTIPFENVKESLKKDAERETFREQYREMMDKLKENAHIEKSPELIKAEEARDAQKAEPKAPNAPPQKK